MMMSKRMMVFGVIMVLTASIVMVVKDGAEAKEIGYGAIGAGGNPGCSPVHPELCKMEPGNPYHRGCETEAQCRGPGGQNNN